MHVRSLRLLFAVLVGLPCTLGFAQQSADIASQIVLLNRNLETRPQFARPSRGALSPNLLNVLQVRQHLVEQLIRTDPGLVRSVMLSPSVAQPLSAASPAYAAALESDSSWSGTLEGVLGDDFEHGTSSTQWYLRSGDQRIELFFAGNANPVRDVHRSVVIRGIGTSRVVSVESLHADSIAPANPPGQNCTSLGVENTAVLVMNQPIGGTAYPNPLFGTTSFWTQDYFGSGSPSANNYWQEASFGLTSGTGSIYGPYAFSANEQCTVGNQYTTEALASDAIVAAQAQGIDFSNFSRISIIFPVSSCSFGGLGDIGCRSADSHINHPYSITWIPVVSYYPITQVLWGVITHELGHNLGLHHSSSLNFGSIPLGAIDYSDPYPNSGIASPSVGVRVEYGDPYTVMGGGSYTCGAQYTAFNKAEYLAWMNRTSDVNEITSSGGSFKVVPFENSSGLRALRILRDPLSSSWIWMEYRQALGNYDSALSTCDSGSNILSGANVYYESPYSEDGHLFLLDMNAAGSPGNFNAGALTPGNSWTDPYSLLRLSVTSADSTGINVATSYDQPCATLQISNSGIFSSTGGTGTITVTAPNTCSWTASTVDSWITIDSGASGTGNGSVGFTLASNSSSTSQRNGYITVQRQSVPVTEKGTNTFVSNLSPILQSGSSGVPVFTFNDPAGIGDINYVSLKIGADDCFVEVTQSSGTFYMFLLDPATNNFSNSLIPGQSGTASNANCTLNAATSTVSKIGNQFQIGLGLTFAQSFAGSYRVTASVCDGTSGNTCTSDISIGTWQVSLPASISGLDITSGKQGASVPITISGTNTHFSGSSTVSVSGGGVTVSGLSATSTTQLGATLTIDPNATASARTVTVTTGTEAVTSSFTVNASGQAQLSSATLTFANQNPYTTSSAQQVMLTNNGHATLNILSITASNNFGVTHNCGSTLAVSASCTLNITFQPVNVSNLAGTVTIVDDAPTSPQTIAASGFGNFIIPISRPARPGFTPSASARTGAVSRAIFAIGDFGVTSASDLICKGSRKLTCSIETGDSPEHFNVAIDATLARPGSYVLHISSPQAPSLDPVAVRVTVLRRDVHPVRPTP
jgi:hypothetical protein